MTLMINWSPDKVSRKLREKGVPEQVIFTLRRCNCTGFGLLLFDEECLDFEFPRMAPNLKVALLKGVEELKKEDDSHSSEEE